MTDPTHARVGRPRTRKPTVRELEPLEFLFYVPPEGVPYTELDLKAHACVECGTRFAAPDGYPFCSFKCSRIIRRECGYCGEMFTPAHVMQRFCKPSCRQSYHVAEKV